LSFLIFACLNACGQQSEREATVYANRTDPDKMYVAITRGDVSMVRRLLDDGLSPDLIIGDRYQDRPLHVAAYADQLDIVVLLLDRGADVNARMSGASVVTPLQNAIWKKRVRVVKLLLERGADPSIPLASGISTCEFAKRSGDAEIVSSVPNCG
jgi:ankyrin repeat protein